MPNIRLRVYDTQNNTWNVDTDVDVETMKDVKDLIGFNQTTRYTDKADRSNPFEREDKLVTGDLTIFASPTSSKAGK
jgi:hypothetical protein